MNFFIMKLNFEGRQFQSEIDALESKGYSFVAHVLGDKNAVGRRRLYEVFINDKNQKYYYVYYLESYMSKYFECELRRLKKPLGYYTEV